MTYGVIFFNQGTCVPNYMELRIIILDEAYKSEFTVHPSSSKMYQILKKNYWWPEMQKDVAKYVVGCTICQ